MAQIKRTMCIGVNQTLLSPVNQVTLNNLSEHDKWNIFISEFKMK